MEKKSESYSKLSRYETRKLDHISRFRDQKFEYTYAPLENGMFEVIHDKMPMRHAAFVLKLAAKGAQVPDSLIDSALHGRGIRFLQPVMLKYLSSLNPSKSKDADRIVSVIASKSLTNRSLIVAMSNVLDDLAKHGTVSKKALDRYCKIFKVFAIVPKGIEPIDATMALNVLAEKSKNLTLSGKYLLSNQYLDVARFYLHEGLINRAGATRIANEVKSSSNPDKELISSLERYGLLTTQAVVELGELVKELKPEDIIRPPDTQSPNTPANNIVEFTHKPQDTIRPPDIESVESIPNNVLKLPNRPPTKAILHKKHFSPPERFDGH